MNNICTFRRWLIIIGPLSLKVISIPIERSIQQHVCHTLEHDNNSDGGVCRLRGASCNMRWGRGGRWEAGGNTNVQGLATRVAAVMGVTRLILWLLIGIWGAESSEYKVADSIDILLRPVMIPEIIMQTLAITVSTKNGFLQQMSKPTVC